ncbi:MAG: hypothetical protein WD972_00105 [Candidatus Andersenbacteria bacterium]
MLSLTHTLVSLPFAFYFDNVFLVFFAAVVFHFFCDTLLHWNLYPEESGAAFIPLVALEIALGVVAAWLLVGNLIFTLPVLLAIAGGNFPDVLHQLWNMLGPGRQAKWFSWATPAFDWHERLQLETSHVGHGLIWQIILCLGAWILISLPLS